MVRVSVLVLFLTVVVVTLVLGSKVDGSVVYYGGWKLASWNNRPPGFKARITQSGLDFMQGVGIEMIQAKIGEIVIPDMHGSADVSVIGTVYYDISGMQVDSVQIPTSSLKPDPSLPGVALSSSGVSFNVHGDWDYYSTGFIPVADSGYFYATASSITLQLNLRIGIDADGRPTVSSQDSDCYFYVSDVNVDLHGGASWFYNLFKDTIVNSMKDAMNQQVCTTVLNQVNVDLAQKLQTLTMLFPIEDVAQVDYSLVASPTFNASIDTTHKGEVYAMGDKSECPLPIPEIPSDTCDSSMMYLWITEYLPNSAGYALQNSGILQYTVTPDNIPPAEKKYLNTSYVGFKLLIPEISKMYPNMAMEINLNSTKAPACVIKPDGIQAVFVGDFSPYAILPNKSLAFLFTLNVTINTNLDVSSSNNNITWKVLSLSTKMALVRSAIGKFSTDKLEVAVNAAIKMYFINQINDYGAIGIALPQVEGLTFSSPVITQGQAFLKIGTDLLYTP